MQTNVLSSQIVSKERLLRNQFPVQSQQHGERPTLSTSAKLLAKQNAALPGRDMEHAEG